jgi:hypothetical protein
MDFIPILPYSERSGMKKKTNSNLPITIDIYDTYPYISDELINSLGNDFQNRLPDHNIDSFELGKLIGQQSVIEKLKIVQRLQQEESEIKDEEKK